MRWALRIALVLAMLCSVVTVMVTERAAAAVTVSIHPRTTYAAVGETISVYIWKDLPDTQFDGYETVIRYNPSELRYISAREETVMTNNCGSRWWYLSPGTGTVFISHVRMCPPLTLVTGPGALSALRFKVLTEARIVITCDYFWFTNAGYWIKNVTWQDGLVLVGSAGVGSDPHHETIHIVVRAVPNPGREFRFALDAPAEQVAIYDIAGRLIRTIDGGTDGGRLASPTWDGRDLHNRACPPGVYFAVPEGKDMCGQRCGVVLVR